MINAIIMKLKNGSLKIHLESIHKGVLYSCDQCEYKFTGVTVMHGVDAIIELDDEVDCVMTGVTVLDGVDGMIVVTSFFLPPLSPSFRLFLFFPPFSFLPVRQIK